MFIDLSFLRVLFSPLPQTFGPLNLGTGSQHNGAGRFHLSHNDNKACRNQDYGHSGPDWYFTMLSIGTSLIPIAVLSYPNHLILLMLSGKIKRQ
jgi:hypothetical protein